MIRELDIEVDQASWGAATVPANFVSGREQINIEEVLLTIGIITSPSRASGFSLAEYWAWIRYISAISPNVNLCLVPEYREIDSHQKMILSDDFGMGFSMYWLWKRMRFSFICDGRYFVERYARHFGAAGVARTPGKRGPTKCPDFVCWQPAGLFHVVECKGTQSGEAARTKQITTAQAQKTTIVFPAARQGERLACGMTISLQGDPTPSKLYVADPDGKVILDISENHVGFAEDIMYRGLISRALAASGMPSTALAFAEPDSGAVTARQSKRLSQAQKDALLGIDSLRKARAEQELRQAPPPLVFTEGGTTFIGREREFVLPISAGDGRREMGRVIVRQGINRDALESLTPSRFDEQVAVTSAAITAMPANLTTASAGGDAMLQLGTLYCANLRIA
jgi:hypothetical protein